MKVGVIGCGGMGTTHILALKALSEKADIQVTALADCREEFLEKAMKIWPEAQAFNMGADLIEQAEIDAVHICVPSYLHAAHAVEAMKKGMAVLIEKPVCLTEEECSLLEETQKETGAIVMVGHVVRFMEEYKFLKETYESKKYGKLKSLVMHRISGFPVWGFEDWFSDTEKSGSVVLDLHVHDSDFLRYMLGEPEEVKSYGTKLESGLVNQIITTYQYEDLNVVAEGSWDRTPGLPFEAYYRACFEDATLVFSNTAEKNLTIYEKDGGIQYPELGTAKQGEAKAAGINISDLGPYFNEIKYFYECLEGKKEITMAPLAEGIRSMKLARKEYSDCIVKG